MEPPLLPHISAAVQSKECKFVQQLRTWMVGLVRQKKTIYLSLKTDVRV